MVASRRGRDRRRGPGHAPSTPRTRAAVDSACEGTPVERAPMRMAPCRTALAPHRVTSVAAKNVEKQVRRAPFERARDSVDGVCTPLRGRRVKPSAEQGRRRSPNQGSSTNESVHTRRVCRGQGTAVPACARTVGVSSTPATTRGGGHDGPSRAVASVRGGADDSAQTAAPDDAPEESPSVQSTRELLLPFAACSSARTALISAEEAAMIADAARSLATREWTAAAEKRARARGEAVAQVASASVHGAAQGE